MANINRFGLEYSSGLYMSESDGPDKLKDTYACYLHHSGARTFTPAQGAVSTGTHVPITDYNCCCNPCSYKKIEFVPFGNHHHCCKCIPKIIGATYTPIGVAECCVGAEEPLFLNFAPIGSSIAVYGAQYFGSIAGHDIKVYQSRFPIDDAGQHYETGVGGVTTSGCYWTVLATGLNVNTEIDIDHTGVTCLGVPDIEITGVPAYNGCIGSISLNNFDTKKVPFNRRSDFFPEVLPRITGSAFDHSALAVESDYWNSNPGLWRSYEFGSEGSGLLIPIPSGKLSPPYIPSGVSHSGQNHDRVIDVTWPFDVPRTLCVKVHNTASDETKLREFSLAGTASNLDTSPYVTGNLYNDAFFPYEFAEGHPAYTGIIQTGVYLARWQYLPLSGYYSDIGQPESEAPREEVYLVQTWRDALTTHSGDPGAYTSGEPQYELRVDFESPYWHSGGDVIKHPTYLHPIVHPDLLPFSAGTMDTGGEDYYPATGSIAERTLDVTKFGCDFAATATYDNFPGDPDIRTANIRGGRCTCWKYYCGDACRCVPEALCYWVFTADSGQVTLFNQGKMHWDASSKTWSDSSVGGTGSGLSIYVVENTNGFEFGTAGESFNGFCEMGLSGNYLPVGKYPDSQLTQRGNTCDDVMTFLFSANSPSGDSYLYFSAHSSFGDTNEDCERVRCGVEPIASPCATGCASHPQSLTFEVSGTEAEVEEGEPGLCTFTTTLQYYQQVNVLPGTPVSLEVSCGYRTITSNSGLLEYHGGSDLTTANIDYIDSDSTNVWSFENGGSPGEHLSEACEPYEAEMTYDYGGPNDWPFPSVCNFQIDKLYFTITEN